jgi:hypothetical protein
LSLENPTKEAGKKPGGKKTVLAVTMVVLTLLLAACGAGSTGGGPSDDPGRQGEPEETTAERTKEAVSGETAELARAEIGKREITNMLPADGGRPDPPRPLPREPPTNGNHAPLWQNCGFYREPVRDRRAVHSMDHGVVWITYRPDLPKRQLETLRPYGNENYVMVSPYPGQDAPVIATSWRVQLELDTADDPRLDQFVNEFKISELAPLSGNRCVLGVGDPKG